LRLSARLGTTKDARKIGSALSGGPEGDGFAVGGVEGLGSAGVPAVADLQGVTSRFDWPLVRLVHLD
jgi:hypothetical protein